MSTVIISLEVTIILHSAFYFLRQSSKASAFFSIKGGFHRAPEKVHIFISIMPISSPNSMFDHLLESSHRDDSNKWSNIGFDEEIKDFRIDKS